MSYLMFIRHGYKEYKNNHAPKGKPQHDPPLKEGYTREIIRSFMFNFNSNGYPDIIYCSPFLRTRQTLEIVKKIIPNDTEIIIDKEVEEFLGFQKPRGSFASLDVETEKYTKAKLGVENFMSLEKRAKSFYEKVKNSNKNILVITHGIFIYKIGNIFNINLGNIKELEGVLIRDLHIKKI